MEPVSLLQELLQVDSTGGNEGPAAEILESHLSAAGFKCDILISPEGRRNLVARLNGSRSRPALVLLSHTDVVGVERDSWSRDPFGGEIAEGSIWGRGALDMKGIAAMHVAAGVALAERDQPPGREVIVVSVADEETGGAQGAKWLLEDHADSIGFGEGRPAPEVLGEGAYGLAGVLDRPVMPIVLGEKTSLWVDLRATGQPGHGSLPPVDQAPHNLARFVASVDPYFTPRVHPVMRRQFAALAGASTGPQALAFRALASGAAGLAARAVAPKLRASGAIGALISDTASLTVVDAGYQHNVVPGEARASLDCRLLPDTDPATFLAKLRRKARRYAVEVEARAPMGGPVSEPGPLFDALARASTRAASGCIVVPTLCPGMTDVRYFRARGATGYGWVPLVLEKELLDTIHGHDERVPVDAFERAVDAMSALVADAAS